MLASASACCASLIASSCSSASESLFAHCSSCGASRRGFSVVASSAMSWRSISFFFSSAAFCARISSARRRLYSSEVMGSVSGSASAFWRSEASSNFKRYSRPDAISALIFSIFISRLSRAAQNLVTKSAACKSASARFSLFSKPTLASPAQQLSRSSESFFRLISTTPRRAPSAMSYWSLASAASKQLVRCPASLFSPGRYLGRASRDIQRVPGAF